MCYFSKIDDLFILKSFKFILFCSRFIRKTFVAVDFYSFFNEHSRILLDVLFLIMLDFFFYEMKEETNDAEESIEK